MTKEEILNKHYEGQFRKSGSIFVSIETVYKCMQDYSKEINKHLQHFKDSNLGLYATDKPIGDLLHLFFNQHSDSNKYLSAEQQEEIEQEFNKFANEKTVSWQLTK